MEGSQGPGGSPGIFYAWIQCRLDIKTGGASLEMPPAKCSRLLDNNQSSHISMNLLSVNT